MTHPVRSHGFTALGPLHEAFARLTGWPAVITSLLLGGPGDFIHRSDLDAGWCPQSP